MLITLGEGDKGLKCLPCIITLWRVLREFYEYGTGPSACVHTLTAGALSRRVRVAEMRRVSCR